jgi:hypothetical protein
MDETNSIREIRERSAGDLDSQPCFANAAGPGYRYQPAGGVTNTI